MAFFFLFCNEQPCDCLYLFKARFFLGSQHGMLLKPRVGSLNGEGDNNALWISPWLPPFVQPCSVYSPNAVRNCFIVICFPLHNFI